MRKIKLPFQNDVYLIVLKSMNFENYNIPKYVRLDITQLPNIITEYLHRISFKSTVKTRPQSKHKFKQMKKIMMLVSRITLSQQMSHRNLQRQNANNSKLISLLN